MKKLLLKKTYLLTIVSIVAGMLLLASCKPEEDDFTLPTV